MRDIDVIILDDDDNILSYFHKTLSEESFGLLTTSSSQQALAVLQQQQVKVIISDQNMPGLSGIDFLQQVKQCSPDTVRVILTGGGADPQIMQDAINKGEIFRFINKPCDVHELKAIIAEALSKYVLQRREMPSFEQIVETRPAGTGVSAAPKPTKGLFSRLYDRYIDWISNLLLRWAKKELGFEKTILIVDDKIDLVNLMKYVLQEKRYRVMTAKDGLEALDRIKNIKPDLIILDVNMPRMGGLEFYKKISNKYGRSQYPVLVLTERTHLQEMFRDIEVDGFMPKPFEIKELVKEVDRILSGNINPLVYLVEYPGNPRAREIKKILEKQRYEVDIVENFDRLRETVDRDRTKYIIMEYMQKDMSGEDMIRRIKAEPALAQVPVIVYSYAGFDINREKSINAGADKYLGQPQNYDVFVAALHEFEVGKAQRWG